jgi:hypothetical protein
MPLTEQNVLPVAKEFNKTTGTPLDGLQLVIGIRATKPGIAADRAVDVRYRVGGRHYHEVFRNYVHLCAPLSEYVDTVPAIHRTIRDCPPRELEDMFDDGAPTPPDDEPPRSSTCRTAKADGGQ